MATDREEVAGLPIEKFPPCVLSGRNAIMLQHLIIIFHFIICQVVAYRRLENFKLFSSKTGRSHLWEVVVQIQGFHLETSGILENWSLRRGGHLQGGHNFRFNCIYSRFPLMQTNVFKVVILVIIKNWIIG